MSLLKDEHDDVLKRFEEAIADVKVRMRQHLLEKPYEEMKTILKDYPDNELAVLCNIYDPEHEDYEICQAVAEILEERKK